MIELLPRPAALIKSEKKTLEYLSTENIVVGNHRGLADEARIALARAESHPELSFDARIDVEDVEGKCVRHVHVGALIELDKGGEYDQISYYMALCENAQCPSKILRKFHFDVALPDFSRLNSHPPFHLQYCGKLSPNLELRGYELKHYEHLSPHLSQPRIPFPPFSLAMTLNIILHEYGNETNRKWREDGRWRNIVRNNERLILTNYYEKCVALLCKKSENRLLADFIYGDSTD